MAIIISLLLDVKGLGSRPFDDCEDSMIDITLPSCLAKWLATNCCAQIIYIQRSHHSAARAQLNIVLHTFHHLIYIVIQLHHQSRIAVHGWKTQPPK